MSVAARPEASQILDQLRPHVRELPIDAELAPQGDFAEAFGRLSLGSLHDGVVAEAIAIEGRMSGPHAGVVDMAGTLCCGDWLQTQQKSLARNLGDFGRLLDTDPIRRLPSIDVLPVTALAPLAQHFLASSLCIRSMLHIRSNPGTEGQYPFATFVTPDEIAELVDTYSPEVDLGSIVYALKTNRTTLACLPQVLAQAREKRIIADANRLAARLSPAAPDNRTSDASQAA